MTPRQREIYEYLVEYIKEHKGGPTMKQVADRFGTTVSNIARIYNLLELDGWITFQVVPGGRRRPGTMRLGDGKPPETEIGLDGVERIKR